jgi:hypothetical protein
MGEQRCHPLASESSHRPSVVKPTVTASIQYCDRTAVCVCAKSTQGAVVGDDERGEIAAWP